MKEYKFEMMVDKGAGTVSVQDKENNNVFTYINTRDEVIKAGLKELGLANPEEHQHWKVVVDGLQKDYSNLIKDYLKLKEVAKRREWVYDGEFGNFYCPECSNAKERGHTLGCEMGTALE